jgi:putative transposase
VSQFTKALRRRPHGCELKHLDLNVGDHLLFPNEGGGAEDEFWEFKGLTAEGMLRLVSDRSGRPKVLTEHSYNLMRGNGEAVRFMADAPGAKAASEFEIHPGLTEDSLVEFPQRIKDSLDAKRRKIARARIVRQFTIFFDERTGWVAKGEVALDRFIQANSQKVNHYGLDWEPSATTLRNAIRECGEPGNRPLTAFIQPGSGSDPVGGGRWHPLVQQLKREMIDRFWSSSKVRHCDAIDRFKDDFTKRRKDHEALGHTIKPPSESVMRNWINDAGTPENVARKWGKKVANATLRATGIPSLVATRILEYVLIDHTPLDVWAKIVDAQGKTVFVARPNLTLAMDLFSRTVIAAIISFEPPSLDSVMACVRQIVRPKDWLVAKYGELKGATDVWGRPKWVVVDNGLEFVSPSFQTSLEAAGIDVIWAPVKNPQYKIYIERMFKTLNDLLWHRMPGAIPMSGIELSKLELEVEPPDEAEFTVEELSDIFWDAIVTVYHLEVHEGIDMAPARAWTAGKKRKGRRMVNDVRVLEKLFGRITTGTLTVKGISIDNMRFSDQRKVTGLLGRLLPRAPKRGQNKGLLSSGKVEVILTIYHWTAEKIGVWDPVQNLTIELPNVHPRYAAGQTWFEANACQAFADRENLAFHSEEERCAARVALAARISGKAVHKTREDKRVAIRSAATPRDAEVGSVIEVTAPPSYDGMLDDAVPVGIPADEMKARRKPPRAPRRGGKLASKKAAETKKARQTARRLEANPDASPRAFVPARQETRPMDEATIENTDALLDQLADDLDWKY